MNSKVLLSSVGLALIGAAVLIGFINDGFGDKDFVADHSGAVAGRSMMGDPAVSTLMGASAASTLVGAPTVPPRMGAGGMLPIAGTTGSPSFWAPAALPVAQPVEISPQAAIRPDQQAPQAAVQANPRTAPQTGTPGNFIPKKIALSEAHWQGMDTMRLTSELRRKLRFPRGLKGILIDEVTLNAAKSGFLAGDVIVQVNNDRVTTLEEFQQSSRKVRNLSQVPLTVLRKTDQTQNGRFAITRMTLLLRGEPDLGFAQVEAAPMIAPGDGRPHPYRGSCTGCHTIGKGFELTPDPDLIILPPPVITKATADKGVSPHLDRGPCIACHTIMY